MAKRKNGNGTTKQGKKEAALQRHNNEELTQRLAATPFTFMRRFSEEMDHLFEDFGLGRGWMTPILDKANLPQGIWSPQVEVLERDNELVVRADLPGLTKDDINVEFSDEGIIIEGERKNEKEEKGEGYYRTERSYGKFYRRIPVPEGVNAENAKATFDHGVLEIIMPATKREPTKVKRIEIGSGDTHHRARARAA